MSASTDSRAILSAASAALERAAADPLVAAAIDGEELRRTLAASLRTYVRQVEAGQSRGPFPTASDLQPTATDVLVAVTELLAACDVELFELGMWQVWGGVRTIDESAMPAGEATHEHS